MFFKKLRRDQVVMEYYHRGRKHFCLPCKAVFLCRNSAEAGELFLYFCCSMWNILSTSSSKKIKIKKLEKCPALPVNGKMAQRWSRTPPSPHSSAVLNLFGFSFIFKKPFPTAAVLCSCREPKLGPGNVTSTCLTPTHVVVFSCPVLWALERPREQKQ